MREQSVKYGAIKRLSSASERANKQADEPSTLRVDFRSFLPRVHGWRTAGGSGGGGGDGGGAQWDKIAITRCIHFIEEKNPPKSSGARE